MGIQKAEPDIGGFGGAVIVHCDLTAFIQYLSNVKVLDHSIGWLFNTKGEVLLKPDKNYSPLDLTPYIFDSKTLGKDETIVSGIGTLGSVQAINVSTLQTFDRSW